MERAVFVLLIVAAALEEAFLLLLGVVAALVSGFWGSGPSDPSALAIFLFFIIPLPPILWGLGTGKLGSSMPKRARVLKLSGGLLSLVMMVWSLYGIYLITGSQGSQPY